MVGKNLNMANLSSEIRTIIAEIGEIDEPERITDDADFFNDLDLDSMMAMEIILEIEQRYAVKIDENELKNVRSLRDAVRLAESALAKL